MRKNKYTKGLIFLMSLIISLAFLEMSMGLVGHIYKEKLMSSYSPYDEPEGYIRDKSYERFSSKENVSTILAIGDSFTNAGNVKSSQSYPYYLYKNFLENDKPREVLNMGLCEDSTFGVRDRLKEFLGKGKKVDSIIILIGAADNFERYEIETDDNIQLTWQDVNPPAFYKSSHIYKMYRFIKMSFIQKYIVGTVESKEGDYEDIKKIYLELTRREKVEDLKSYLDRLPSGFVKYCEDLNIKFSTKDELSHSVLVYMTKVLANRLAHDEAFFWLMDLATFHPKKFWNGEFDDAYFRLVQIYQLQSKYDQSFVSNKLKDAVAKDPSIVKEKLFKEFEQLLKEQKVVGEYVNSKRIEAWDDIAKMSKKYNTKVFVVNYPSDYHQANRAIEAASVKHGFKLIDANQFFSGLMNSQNRGVYLEDDDHLTPLGYKKLAKLIYSNFE